MCCAVCCGVPAAMEGFLASTGSSYPDCARPWIGDQKTVDPELEEKRDFILNVISKEEDQFNKTIDQGLGILAEMEGEMKEKGETVLSGDHAFKLYDPTDFRLI